MQEFKLTVELTASETLLSAIRMLAAGMPKAHIPEPEVKETAETTAPVAEIVPPVLTAVPHDDTHIEVTLPADEPEVKVSTATAQEVRDAMQKIRNKFEYGTPEPGEEKGPNPDRDPAIKKKLTAYFKEIASALEKGVLPSELTKENKAIFIQHIAGTTLTDDGFVAPF